MKNKKPVAKKKATKRIYSKPFKQQTIKFNESEWNCITKSAKKVKLNAYSYIKKSALKAL